MFMIQLVILAHQTLRLHGTILNGMPMPPALKTESSTISARFARIPYMSKVPALVTLGGFHPKYPDSNGSPPNDHLTP